MDIYIRFALYTSLFVWRASSESLTFLGESLAKYPRWNAKEKGTLNFQFKTSKPKGILLYMHGKRRTSMSFLKLSLEIGRLRLAISHSPEENIEEELGRDLHDSTWHNVTITRNHRTTLFELDGTQRIVTKLHWKGILEVTSDLYVGNMEKIVRHDGFIGCIKDLKYSEGYTDPVMYPLKTKGLKTLPGCYNYCYKDTTKPLCNTGTCVNKFTDYECDCFGAGYEGNSCEKKSPIIFLHANMDFISKSSNSIQSIRSNKIQVRFKTTQKDGILLTIGKANDYITLELYEGFVRVETNVGGGKVILQNDRHLHDGQWHDIKLSQSGAEFHLVVDSKSVNRFEQTKSSPYKNIDASCYGEDIAYFGGHFNPITVIGSKSKQGFVGCLQQFYFNEINLIEDVLITLNILKRSNKTLTHTKVDGAVETKCNILPRLITEVKTPPKTKQPTKRTSGKKIIVVPTLSHTIKDGTDSHASIKYQSPLSGERNTSKLKKSSVAWITAGLVLGALVIILVMVFLVHRFRKKYRGTFMAPRDENGMPYYSSVQATYHIQNGVGKRQGRTNVTDV